MTMTRTAKIESSRSAVRSGDSRWEQIGEADAQAQIHPLGGLNTEGKLEFRCVPRGKPGPKGDQTDALIANIEALERLSKLKAEGAISESEFEKAKARLLNGAPDSAKAGSGSVIPPVKTQH